MEIERGEHLKKRLYVLAYPETKSGGAPGKTDGKGGKAPKANADSKGVNFTTLPTPSFVKDTAAKTGMSESAIEKSVHRAEKIDEEVKQCGAPGKLAAAAAISSSDDFV